MEQFELADGSRDEALTWTNQLTALPPTCPNICFQVGV